MFDYKLKDGKWFYKTSSSPKILTKREHDLPAFRAVYGIEGTVKDEFKSTVEAAAKEMGRKLLSSLTK
jgi:hypothetical protein